MSTIPQKPAGFNPQQLAAGAMATAAQNRQEQVRILIDLLAAAIKVGNFTPSTRGFEQSVVNDVIVEFAKNNWSVVCTASTRNGRHWKIS